MTAGLPAPDPAQAIAAAYDTLTDAERRAATFLLEHLTDVPLYSSAELADRAGVSPPTLSRLVRRLGYPGARAFRGAVAAAHAPGSPAAAPAPSGLAAHVQRQQDVLQRTLARVDGDALREAAARVRDARRVVVAGLRNSHPIALHLREQLLQLRGGVALAALPGQTIAEELADLAPEDVAIVIAMRRRPPVVAPLLAALADRNVTVVVIGDSTARTILPAAGPVTLFEADVADGPALASYTAAFALAELLADAVADVMPDVPARVAAIDDLFTALGELERPTRRRRP